MNTKILMISSTLFLGVSGAFLTFLPDEIISHIATPNPFLTLSLQILGALYLGFAMLNWMAKEALIGGIYNKPLIIGNFMHFGVGVFALVKIIPEIKVNSIIVISLAAIYAAFTILFAYVFRTNPPQIK